MNNANNTLICADAAWYIDAAVRLTEELPTAPEDEKWRIEVSIDTLVHLANTKIYQTLNENDQRTHNGIR